MKNKGITLIALVITIILMLILVIVTVVMSTNSGLFDYAGRAAKETTKAKEKEIITTMYLIAQQNSQTSNDLEQELNNQANESDTITSVTLVGNSFIIKCSSNNEYIVDENGNIKDKNGIMACEITSQHYGDYVFNYSDIDIKDGGSSQLADWRIFYAGKVADEEEDHIYLIASNFLDYDSLPQSKNGHALNLGNSQYHANTGSVMSDYSTGSAAVAEETRYLNSGYFGYLSSNNLTSTNNNMKTVAYMCDTSVWNSFKTDKADFVIGSPTIELLFKSYNNKYGTNYLAGSTLYSESVNAVAYKLSLDGGATWVETGTTNTIANNSLYRFSGERYWIASPATGAAYNFRIDGNGQVDKDGNGGVYNGFRPVVRLKADIGLEEVEGGYRIK